VYYAHIYLTYTQNSLLLCNGNLASVKQMCANRLA